MTVLYEPIGYLETDYLKSRYVLAAHFLKDCKTIIEIGGMSSTIDKFTNDKSKNIVVCDPGISPLEEDNLLYIKDFFENVDFSNYSDFGLCVLGVDFASFDDAGNWSIGGESFDALLGLIHASDRTVIEGSTEFEPSMCIVDAVTTNTSKKIVSEISLYFPTLNDNHYARHRRLLVLE